MKSFYTSFAILLLSGILSACSSEFSFSNVFKSSTSSEPSSAPSQTTPPLATQTHEELSDSRAAIGGSIAVTMDSFDQTRLNRALDAGIGKTTTWISSHNSVTYAVTPVKKVTIENNTFCREYLVTANKGSNQRVYNGRACVSSDGNWHEV